MFTCSPYLSEGWGFETVTALRTVWQLGIARWTLSVVGKLSSIAARLHRAVMTICTTKDFVPDEFSRFTADTARQTLFRPSLPPPRRATCRTRCKKSANKLKRCLTDDSPASRVQCARISVSTRANQSSEADEHSATADVKAWLSTIPLKRKPGLIPSFGLTIKACEGNKELWMNLPRSSTCHARQ